MEDRDTYNGALLPFTKFGTRAAHAGVSKSSGVARGADGSLQGERPPAPPGAAAGVNTCPGAAGAHAAPGHHAAALRLPRVAHPGGRQVICLSAFLLLDEETKHISCLGLSVFLCFCERPG